jgi:hypothetical protein
VRDGDVVIEFHDAEDVKGVLQPADPVAVKVRAQSGVRRFANQGGNDAKAYARRRSLSKYIINDVVELAASRTLAGG